MTKHFSGFSVRHEQTEDGKIITHGSDLAAELDFRNPWQALKGNVWGKYRFRHKRRAGSPPWYLIEPGVWQLILVSENFKAIQIQKWVYEDVLPDVNNTGGYILPTATIEQLDELQRKIDHLKAALTN